MAGRQVRAIKIVDVRDLRVFGDKRVEVSFRFLRPLGGQDPRKPCPPWSPRRAGSPEPPKGGWACEGLAGRKQTSSRGSCEPCAQPASEFPARVQRRLARSAAVPDGSRSYPATARRAR